MPHLQSRDEAGLAALAIAAVDASFAPEEVTVRLRGEIAAYVQEVTDATTGGPVSGTGGPPRADRH